jgi:putative FmdB family regulatory protein
VPLYEYECGACGVFEATHSIHDEPLALCGCGEPVKRIITTCNVLIGAEHRAVTNAGPEGDKRAHRHHRVNKEVAEGLAKGTMNPPDDRPVAGDKQTRESVRQFNEMYQTAKNG